MGIKRPWLPWGRIVLLLAVLALLALARPPKPVEARPVERPAAQTTTSCTATYTLTAQWTGGFLGNLVVRNTGTTTITGWTVNWTFLNGQTVYGTTSSTFTQTGANMTVTNVAWNGTITPGNPQGGGICIQGIWSGTNSMPVNVTCTPKVTT